MKNAFSLIVVDLLLSIVLTSPAFSTDSLPTPTPLPCGSFFRLTDVELLEVVNSRGTTRYDLVYQLRDTTGAIVSWGHIFDTENRSYDKQTGEGDVLLRTFAHKGFSTQTGDNLLLTYDGGWQKRIYLPVLTGYTELYVGADGSTYYDQWLCQIAREASNPTPSPTLSPIPTLTPVGFRTATPTPYAYTCPSSTPTPTPPYCYGCPRVLPGAITLSDQTSSQDIIYDFTYNCLRQTNLIHNWWTSATEWLEVEPSQGFGFDSQTFVIAITLGDTSSLSPGAHSDWIRFDHDWGCEETYLVVNYYIPTPSPTPPPEFFRLTDIEGVRIIHPRGSGKYDLVYQLRDVAGGITSWGHIFDTENRSYDKQTGEGDVLLRTFAHRGFNTQTGDDLLLTYDGGRQKRIYLPVLTGYTELYVGSDGSTYYDQLLYQIAQKAFDPTPTPTLTPKGFHFPTTTPVAYRTPTPPISPTPSPIYCSGCPHVSPGAITLSAQTSSRDIIYNFTFNCLRQTNLIHNWWTTATDWLEVDPPQGFGFDSQVFEVTISLGDTSSLSPGTHTAWVTFSDDWPCNMADLCVTYRQTTPTPVPPPPSWPPTPPPTRSPTPPMTPTPTPSPTLPISPTSTPSPSLAPTPPILILGSGDYDGDGTSDIAVFRDTAGLWALRGVSRLYFGAAGDLPVSGDYDGDGTTDIGIFRKTSGLWALRGLTRTYAGGSSDMPVPGDYDGDGCCDIGIFDSGLWDIVGITRIYFGLAGDLPVPGDYDGDGYDDIAIFRRSGGLWAIRSITRIYFGTDTDRPVPGDYQGEGSRAPAVFRPATGLWAVRGGSRCYFGSGSDVPVPADFNGNGTDNKGIFRPTSGLWAIRGISRTYFGRSGDIPVTR